MERRSSGVADGGGIPVELSQVTWRSWLVDGGESGVRIGVANGGLFELINWVYGKDHRARSRLCIYN